MEYPWIQKLQKFLNVESSEMFGSDPDFFGAIYQVSVLNILTCSMLYPR